MGGIALFRFQYLTGQKQLENVPGLTGGTYTYYNAEENILYFVCDDTNKTATPNDERKGRTKEYGQIRMADIITPSCQLENTQSSDEALSSTEPSDQTQHNEHSDAIPTTDPSDEIRSPEKYG